MKLVVFGPQNGSLAGSEGKGYAMAIADTLINSAMLNGLASRAWLTWKLVHFADHKITRFDEMMPWNEALPGA